MQSNAGRILHLGGLLKGCKQIPPKGRDARMLCDFYTTSAKTVMMETRSKWTRVVK